MHVPPVRPAGGRGPGQARIGAPAPRGLAARRPPVHVTWRRPPGVAAVITARSTAGYARGAAATDPL